MINFNKKIIFSFITVSLLIITAFVFHKHNKETVLVNAAPYYIQHNVKNISDLKHISASIIINNSERMEVQVDKDRMTESGRFEFSDTIDNAPDIYVMTYRIEKDNFEIIDISISVAGSLIKTNIENISPESLISLTAGVKELHHNVPVDWAGKLNLISIANSQNNLCLEIVTNKEVQSICHSVGKERRAVS